MKWLQDNIIGMALLGGIAALLLVSLALGVIWALPVSGDFTDQLDEEAEIALTRASANTIGPYEDYQAINERPVFNASRAPEAVEEGELVGVVEETITSKEAPDVKLTGVFIAPGLRIASLMPMQGDQISVRAKEGEPLVGEYVGWSVSKVRARHVVLESRDGQTLKLELKVHDAMIAEPPKPQVPVEEAVELAEAEEEIPVGEDGQPLSRAEQIRARIAERREELRRQQEGIESDDSASSGEEQKAKPPPSYQSAIQALMQNSNKDNKSNDN